MLLKKILFFIGDFPEPEPNKSNYFGSGFGQKGRLPLRNTDFYPREIICCNQRRNNILRILSRFSINVQTFCF